MIQVKETQAIPPTESHKLFSKSRDFISFFGLILCGYLFCYFNFSFMWITTISIVLLLYFWQNQHFECDQLRPGATDASYEDEQSTIEQLIRHLPSWVHFPDTMRAEWLNQLFLRLWPFLHNSIERWMRTKLQPNIDEALPYLLSGFRFTFIHFGTVSPQIGSVKCYSSNTSKDEIILDVEVIYNGNCNIELRLKGLPAGCKNLKLRGFLRLELKPLLGQWPYASSLSMYFLQSPQIDFKLTKLGKLLDISGLDNYLKNAINKQIARHLVLPNKHIITLMPNVDTNALRISKPIGLIKIEVIGAKNVKSVFSDFFKPKGKVYVRVAIGSEEKCTNATSNISSPKWSFSHQSPVFDLTQTIAFEVMYTEELQIGTDSEEYLGRAVLPVSIVAKEGKFDDELTLIGMNKGTIQVRAIWSQLQHKRPLDKQMNRKITLGQLQESSFGMTKALIDSSTVDGLLEPSYLAFHSFTTSQSPFLSYDPQLDSPSPVACLLVQLESATNLPMFTCEPSPQVILHLTGTTQKSSIASLTCNPLWNESFYFLVDSFQSTYDLIMEVIDCGCGYERQIGKRIISLQSLLDEPQMTKNGPLEVRCEGDSMTLQHFIVNLNITLYFSNTSE